jgi:putative endopeptidase
MKVATAGTPDPMIDGLTRDQRFFIAYAVWFRDKWTPDFIKMIANSNPHAPSDFRTNGAVSNMPAFAAAFHCKPGDAMVRDGEQRILIW